MINNIIDCVCIRNEELDIRNCVGIIITRREYNN